MEIRDDVEYNVRAFEPDDVELANTWRDLHGYPEVPGGMLPPVGLVAEYRFGLHEPMPLACAHLFEAKGIRMFWPDYLATRPGLVTGVARKALHTIISAFEEMVGEGAIITIRCNGVFAREAEKLGYDRFYEDNVTLVKRIGEGGGNDG